jgi:hypothetical protein
MKTRERGPWWPVGERIDVQPSDVNLQGAEFFLCGTRPASLPWKLRLSAQDFADAITDGGYAA